jgi:hypothetical protein
MFLFSRLHQRVTAGLQTRRTPARKPTPRFRPQLERLEGRDLPSTLTVTTTRDRGDGSLPAAIAHADAGDTIVFDPSLTGQTITLTRGELVLNKSLTISGPGAGQLTVSAGNASRLFEVDGAATNVTLSGLTLTQGDGIGSPNSGEGGAIYNNGGVLTVSDCVLSHNFASTTYGGAIFNLGTLTVNGSRFFDNSARGAGGGAIFNGNSATLDNCTLTGNSAVFGGAVENFGALTVTDSTLSSNSSGPFAGGDGGAIDSGGTLTISQSILIDNHAPFGLGGAISVSGTATINSCTLSDNSAVGGLGGAVSADGIYVSLTINQSTLTDNSADTATYPFNGALFVGQGGALANIQATVTMNQCVLSGNTANGGQGGGVYNRDGTVTIQNNSLLSGNTASGGQGGAVYNSGDNFGGIGTVTLLQSSVSGNAAGTGGGIDNDVGGVLSVVQSSVAGNTAPAGAGADLYNAGSATLSGSTVPIIDGSGSLTVLP